MKHARIAAALVGLLTLSACASTSSPASSNELDEVAAPLPTIGIGSDLGQISGGADLRAIDPGAIESVVMIGDSITVGALPLLEEQFADLGFDDVVIVAKELKRISQDIRDNPSGVDIAAFVVGDDERDNDERLWIVALGTNDISQYNDVDQIVEQIEEMLASVPDDAPLIWINTYFAGRPDDTADVNAAIDQVINSRDNAAVVSWDQVASADGVLRRDGVHPSSEGAKVFASVVTQSVADFLQL